MCNDSHFGSSTIPKSASFCYYCFSCFTYLFKCPYIDPVWSPLRIFLQHGRKDSSFMFTRTSISIVFFNHSVCSCLFWLGIWKESSMFWGCLCCTDGPFSSQAHFFHVVFMSVWELLSLRKQNPSCIAQIHPPAFLPGLWIQTIWSNRNPALQQNSRMISS